MTPSVLIVDDEKNIRLTLAAAIKSMQLDAATAVNGEEALEKIRQSNYDVMLLDIKMPGIDGIQVLERVRALKPEMSIIMITAHGTVENAVEAMKLGAVDFLQKPFTPAEIRELVTTVLKRRALDERVIARNGDELSDASSYDVLIQLTKKYVEQQDFARAVTVVRKAVAAFPNRAEAFNLLGALVEIEGNMLEAQKFYRAAIALDPTYEPARQNLHRTTSWRPTGSITLD